MADSGSSLAAALADIDRFTEQHMPPWSVIVAAARERLRLSRIPCETCGGNGEHFMEPQVFDRTARCPSCGGSGEVYPAELIAKLRAVLYTEQWAERWIEAFLDEVVAYMGTE